MPPGNCTNRPSKLDENNYLIWGNLGDARYWGTQREQAPDAYRQAFALAEELRQTTPEDALLLADMAGYHAMLGNEAEALKLIDRALALAPSEPERQLQAAQVYAQLGRSGEALRRLAEGIEGGLSLAFVSKNPWFSDLRDSSDFQAIVAGR